MFKKGEGGRRKGCHNKYKLSDLVNAISKIEKEKKTNFLEHIVERAFRSDKVVVSLLKKLLPDLREEINDSDTVINILRVINQAEALPPVAPAERIPDITVERVQEQIKESNG